MEKSKGKLALFKAVDTASKEYNRTVSNPSWKVKSEHRDLISGLIRGGEVVVALLARHYDRYQHAQSGAPRVA